MLWKKYPYKYPWILSKYPYLYLDTFEKYQYLYPDTLSEMTKVSLVYQYPGTFQSVSIHI